MFSCIFDKLGWVECKVLVYHVGVFSDSLNRRTVLLLWGPFGDSAEQGMGMGMGHTIITIGGIPGSKDAVSMLALVPLFTVR